MRRYFGRMRGLAFVLWQSRHEFYHVLIGLLWAWVLREIWNEFNLRYILLSVFASLLPDADHFIYFLGYGKNDGYVTEIKDLLKQRSWRQLVLYISHGHKLNTNLGYHNLYFMAFLAVVSVGSFFIEWKAGVVLFGAMVLHYLFDILDDLWILGYINSNWKRWGRGKREA